MVVANNDFMIKLILMAMLFNNTNYKILKVLELERILKKELRDCGKFDQQLKDNGVFVYFLKSGEVILLPNSLNDNAEGIIFSNKDEYQQCIENDCFPIQNTDTDPAEKYQKEIISLKDNMKRNLIYLDSVSGNNQQVDGQIKYDDLPFMIQKLKSQWADLTTPQKLLAAVALGEYIIRMNKGEWVLIKRYGVFNPYYLPGISTADNKFFLLLDQVQMYFEISTITLAAFIKLDRVTNPKDSLHRYTFKRL